MTANDLRLADFRPRTSLRVPAHDVPQPKFAAVDAHNHLRAALGDGAVRPAEVLATLDESGVELVVDLDGGQGDALSSEIDRWQTAAPDRVVVFAGLDYARWTTDRDFGNRRQSVFETRRRAERAD